MNRYLFLISWISGSPSNCGEENGIESYTDLFPEFEKGNQSVFAVEIIAPNPEIAGAFGLAEAFDNNYYETDSASTLMELDPGYTFAEQPYKVVVSTEHDNSHSLMV
jgi:hypothetical protein